MADILIRGLEMPKDNNAISIIIFPNGKVSLAHDKTYAEYAEAIPIPEWHGRLIDADAIEYTYTTARGNDDGHNWRIFAVGQDEIDEMPTIVPAEGGKDE